MYVYISHTNYEFTAAKANGLLIIVRLFLFFLLFSLLRRMHLRMIFSMTMTMACVCVCSCIGVCACIRVVEDGRGNVDTIFLSRFSRQRFSKKRHLAISQRQLATEIYIYIYICMYTRTHTRAGARFTRFTGWNEYIYPSVSLYIRGCSTLGDDPVTDGQADRRRSRHIRLEPRRVK